MDVDADLDGPVTRAIRQCVAGLELDLVGHARAALAVRLAQNLDSGRALMASAAIGRELRETLNELVGQDGAEDEFTAFIASLSAPLRD